MARKRLFDDDETDDRPGRRFGDDDREVGEDRRGGSPLLWLLGGGAVLALLLIGVGLFAYMTIRAERAARREAEMRMEAERRAMQAQQQLQAQGQVNPGGGMAPGPGMQGGTRPVPAPAPAPAPAVGPTPGRVPLSILNPTVGHVAFGGTDAGHAAAVRVGGTEVDVFHARTGKARGTVTLPNASYNGYAVSPDGNWLVVVESAPFKGDEVVVFAVESGEKAGEVTPFPKTTGNLNKPEPVWVQFLAADRLLVVNSFGGYDVFSVPGLKRTPGRNGTLDGGIRRLSANGFTKTPTNFAVTPDGKRLALFDGTGFTVVDPNTGAEVGRSPRFVQPKESVTFHGTALSADGRRLAAFRVSGRTESVLVWDLPANRVVADVPVGAGASAAGMSWWGPDHLVFWQGGLASAELFGVSAGRLVGPVRMKGVGKFVTAPTPGDRLWAVTGGAGYGPGEGAAVLVNFAPPGAVPPGTTFEVASDGRLTR